MENPLDLDWKTRSHLLESYLEVVKSCVELSKQDLLDTSHRVWQKRMEKIINEDQNITAGEKSIMLSAFLREDFRDRIEITVKAKPILSPDNNEETEVKP
ncbi:MAG: hypothetical protein PHX21_12680 [bacterium]|nr:hypothetical protein [bacterium]